MSRHYIKSNSILVAVDSYDSGNGDQRGLSFLGLQDSFGFSVEIPKVSAGQVGSQKLAYEEPSFAPEISFDLSFIPTRTFANENVLGLNFGYNNEFLSVLNGRSESSFNVYLFTSEKQSYDFINQIRNAESLNGVECLALGNCFITQYGFSMRVSDLARATASFVSSNIEASIVSGDRVKMPNVDLNSGDSPLHYLSLDWPQIRVALDELTKEAQPILPTTEVKFYMGAENLETPSAIISPLKDAKIQSLDFGLSIPRETSYRFGSNFPCGRKIKYPVQGQLNVSSIVSQYSTGSFSGIMGGMQKQNVVLNFLDPQEVYLSGKSFAELSGFLTTGTLGPTGFFTESRSLKLEAAKLNSYSQSFPINELVTSEFSFSFQCSESGGLMQKFGVLSDGAQPPHLYSSDSRKIYDPSGNLLTIDPFLYIYDENCEKNYLLDGENNLILADNWTEEDMNACLYVSPPSPAPDILSAAYQGVNESVIVEWQLSDVFDYHALERSTDGTNYQELQRIYTSDTQYFDENLPAFGITLWYRVKAHYFGNVTIGAPLSVYIP